MLRGGDKPEGLGRGISFLFVFFFSFKEYEWRCVLKSLKCSTAASRRENPSCFRREVFGVLIAWGRKGTSIQRLNEFSGLFAHYSHKIRYL